MYCTGHHKWRALNLLAFAAGVPLVDLSQVDDRHTIFFTPAHDLYSAGTAALYAALGRRIDGLPETAKLALLMLLTCSAPLGCMLLSST